MISTPSGRSVAVDGHGIIGESAGRRQIVEALVVEIAELAIDVARRPSRDRTERAPGALPSAEACLKTISLRAAISPRAAEWSCSNMRLQRLEQQGEIGLGKAGALGELGGDEAMGAIEPVGHDVLAAHGAVLGALVAVVARLALGLFFLVGRRHAGDGDFDAARSARPIGRRSICTGPRTWPQLMPVVITAPKVRTSKKLSHMKSRQLDRLGIVLRVELGLLLDLGVVRDASPCRPCGAAR